MQLASSEEQSEFRVKITTADRKRGNSATEFKREKIVIERRRIDKTKSLRLHSVQESCVRGAPPYMGYKIRVWTDHTAIQNLFKHKNLRGRLVRWFVTQQNYEINFEYIPRNRNTAADALQEVNSVVCSMQELTVLDTELVYSE